MKNEEEPQLGQAPEDKDRNVVRDDELDAAMIEAAKDAKLDKMNLDATRRVLYKLLTDQDYPVTAETKLIDILRIIEAEDAKLDKVV